MNRPLAQNSAVTLTEILIAMLILATALLPLIGLLTGGASQSEDIVAMSFVIDRARHVMTALLEEIPFADIRPGNPSILVDSEGTGMLLRLFPGASVVGGGFAAEGVATCSRGIHYHIYLRSEAILDNTDEIVDEELTFSFYKVPDFTSQDGWSDCISAAENDERLHNAPSVIRPDEALPDHVVETPYRFFPADAADVWGPEEEARNGAHRFDQRRIALPNADGEYYMMQRLILQIRWNAASAFYNSPETDQGRPQRFHLVAYKANLD